MAPKRACPSPSAKRGGGSANLRVDVDKQSPRTAARELLAALPKQ
jgi:hypothetical protein